MLSNRVDKVAGFDSRPRTGRRLHRQSLGLCGEPGSDISLIRHHSENEIASRLGSSGVRDRIVLWLRLGQSGERRCLGESQLRRGMSEIMA